MRFLSRTLILALLLMFSALNASAADIVDGIVANVNGHALLQSDWEEELAFECFLNARPLESFTPGEREAALRRLIDQELLREQVRPSELAPVDTVAARVAEVRKLYPEAGGDEGWRATLARHGLTESGLKQRLGAEIELMRLVEAHLRPSVQIDASAIETYYREQLLPELQKKGSGEVALVEVSARIKDLLAEQKMNELIANWLETLRSESRITSSALAPSVPSSPKAGTPETPTGEVPGSGTEGSGAAGQGEQKR